MMNEYAKISGTEKNLNEIGKKITSAAIYTLISHLTSVYSVSTIRLRRAGRAW